MAHPSNIQPPSGRASERQDRHDPAVRKDYLSIQHIERYIFAAKTLRAGMLVLDVASGTGYGTQILSNHGCKVVGGDLDAGELAIVSRKMPDSSFVCLDVLGLPFRNDCFDAVVSFETIEHVIEGRRFLDEMHRILKPGGIFICSTPNIAYTAHPWYHVKEYEPGEFFSLVLAKFGKTEKYGQYLRLVDRMTDRVTWFSNKGGWRKLPRVGLRITLSFFRRLRRLQNHVKKGANSVPDGAGQDIFEGRNYYSVCPYRGTDMLRIMVTVSVK